MLSIICSYYYNFLCGWGGGGGRGPCLQTFLNSDATCSNNTIISYILQTTNIELSVNILERQFSQHDSGTTMREPGTNPDVNEDSQSVQHLTSKFQQLDDQSEGASFKRVS